MEKAFVNSEQLAIAGKQVFEAKIAEVTKAIGKDQAKIDAAMTKEPILLNDKAHGVLLAIGMVPGAVKPDKPTIITLLDDRIPVAKINKLTLMISCETMAEGDKLAGIEYTVPLFVHALPLEYRFQNRIEAIGDVSGLVFYFKN